MRRATALEGLDDDHRPPQQGQACSAVCGSLALVLAALMASIGNNGDSASSSRARAMLSARLRRRAGHSSGCGGSLGQHVHQEAADELVGRERHGLVARGAFDPIVLPFEGDAVVIACEQAAIGDGDAVGVAGEIAQDFLGPAERPLAVDHPLAVAQWCQIGREGLARRAGHDCRRTAACRRNERRGASPETAGGTSGENLREEIARPAPTHLPSSDKPPPGTTMCTCGWWVSAEPQVWKTDMKPMRAPRCLGSAAIVSSVSAEALNRRS